MPPYVVGGGDPAGVAFELMWEPLMHQALALASWQGAIRPQSLVGALVVDSSGRLIGEGYHACAGLPHAGWVPWLRPGLPREAEP